MVGFPPVNCRTGRQNGGYQNVAWPFFPLALVFGVPFSLSTRVIFSNTIVLAFVREFNRGVRSAPDTFYLSVNRKNTEP